MNGTKEYNRDVESERTAENRRKEERKKRNPSKYTVLRFF
jgi:hypothetical protein